MPVGRHVAPMLDGPDSGMSSIHLEALRHQASSLRVEQLQRIGHQIVLRLRGGRDGGNNSGSDSNNSSNALSSSANSEGLEAAALFTATCSTRSDKEQATLLGVQDKVLAGLRPILRSPSVPAAAQRHLRSALLALVAQNGFTKKKKGGYRKHIVQALVAASYATMPPVALLPILQATETGPCASDLILEVLEKIVSGEGGGACHGNGGIDPGGGSIPKASVIELLHHVVAHVVLGNTIARKTGGKGTTTASSFKGSSAHLKPFLVQVCSILPDYIVLFSKDLLPLLESKSGATRKMCLSVLAVILEHGGSVCRGTSGPSLAALLHCARSDSEATVRCAAFNCVAEYLGRNDLPFAHEDFLAMDSNELSEDRGHGEGHNVELPPREMLDRSKESAHKEKQVRQAKPPERTTTDAPKRAGENEEPDNLNDVKERDLRQPGPVPPAPEQRDNPWAKGKAPLAGLSVAARSMLTDDSKAVRSKALACCLRILHAHGESLGSEGVECSRFHPGPSREGMVAALADLVKGVWAALENLAATKAAGGGAVSTSGAATSTGKTGKTADMARDLLRLVPLDRVGGSFVIDLLRCYARCQQSRGAGANVTIAVLEAKRALREIATEKFCKSVDAFLDAVSSVMMAAMATETQRDSHGTCVTTGNPTNIGSGASEDGDGGSPPVWAFCELLLGVDIAVTTSRLQETLHLFSNLHTDNQVNTEDPKQKRNASVLLRAVVLLGEAASHGDDGDINSNNNGSTPRGAGASDSNSSNKQRRSSGGSSSSSNQALRLLVCHETLFWRTLEKLMGQMQEFSSPGKGSEKRQEGEDDKTKRLRGGSDGAAPSSTANLTSSRSSNNKDDDDDDDGEKETRNNAIVVEELAELLGVFRLLAASSLLSLESGAALEELVFPAVLSQRRLIRPAVLLSFFLAEPRRVLLSSLAVMQDAAFGRSSTDVGRACDYVSLIGVLARENASFVATHVQRQYEAFRGRTSGRQFGGTKHREDGDSNVGDPDGDDYMAGVSTREAMEREIRQLQEASVTSDGMLSCYTPFLLAIVKQRVADPRQHSRISAHTSAAPEKVAAGEGSNNPNTFSSLAVEALWTLSEYAVLSPRLAATEVLPLAEALALDSREASVVRSAAVSVLTRRELATDAISARACTLLADADPLLRVKVLRRLGRLMRESRIKTAHLSRFALLLVDEDEFVREAAQTIFFKYLQPQPDSVARCVFETYFTLDAKADVKRRVLKLLIEVSRRVTPKQSLASLGATLVRKTAETGDEGAAFFLSLVPPTHKSLEATELCLRRGHLSQLSWETASLLRDHFAKSSALQNRTRAPNSYSADRGQHNSAAGEGGVGSSESFTLLPRAKAMDMSARIEAALKEQQQRRSGDVIAVGRAVLRSRRVASTGGSGVVATASSIRGGVMTPADGKGEEVGASARSDFRKERYGERGERTRQAIGDGEAVHDEGQESSHDSDDSIIDTNAQQRRNTRGRRRQKKRQGRDVSVFGDAFVVSAAAANRKNSTRRKVARSSKKRGREQQRCIDTETFGEKHRTVVAEPEEGDEESAGNEKDEQIKEAKKGNHAGKIKEKEEKGGEEDDDKEEEDDGKEEEEDDDKEEGEIVTSDCIVSDGIDFSGGSDDSSGMSATELRPREDIDVIPAVAAVIDHGRLPWRPRRREDLTSGTRLEFERAGGRGAGSGRRSIRIARGVGERNSGNDGRAQRAAQRATRKSRSGSSGGSKVQDFRNQDEGILLGTSPRGGGEIRVVRGVNGGEGDGGSGEDSGGCEEGSVEEADIAVNDSGDGDDTNMIFGRESFRAGVENEDGGTESEGEVEGQDRTQQQRQKPNKCSSSTGSKRCFSEHRSTVLLGEEKETEVEDGPDRSLAENDFKLETEAVVIGASTAVARGGSVRAPENGDCETDTTMAKNAKKGKVHTRRTRRRLQRRNGDTKDREESDEDTELFENDQS